PEQPDLDLEGRVADGWSLEPVAQRFIVQLDGAVVRAGDPAVTIPVVDERIQVAHRTGTPIGRAATTRPFSQASSAISRGSTPVRLEALKRYVVAMPANVSLSIRTRDRSGSPAAPAAAAARMASASVAVAACVSSGKPVGRRRPGQRTAGAASPSRLASFAPVR